MKIIASNNHKGWRRFLGWPWLAGLAVLLVVGAWGLSELNRPAAAAAQAAAAGGPVPHGDPVPHRDRRG